MRLRLLILTACMSTLFAINSHADTPSVINPFADDEHITSSADFIEELDLHSNPYGDLFASMTDREANMICSCAYYEANTQNMDGNRAVIEVILNRMLSERWGAGANCSAESVIFQKGQFATAKAVRNKGYYTQKQLDALQLVCEESPILPHTGYVYFDTKGRNGKDKFKLQDHWFGRE